MTHLTFSTKTALTLLFSMNFSAGQPLSFAQVVERAHQGFVDDRGAYSLANTYVRFFAREYLAMFLGLDINYFQGQGATVFEELGEEQVKIVHNFLVEIFHIWPLEECPSPNNKIRIKMPRYLRYGDSYIGIMEFFGWYRTTYPDQIGFKATAEHLTEFLTRYGILDPHDPECWWS